VTDLDQNGQESSPGGTVVKDGEKIHSDFDQANWLVDQINSTLSQEVQNSFTPVGLEQRREIDKISGSTLAPLQTTSWQYFPNGKLSSLTTTAPCSGQTLGLIHEIGPS
jgi:hypothetical protein